MAVRDFPSTFLPADGARQFEALDPSDPALVALAYRVLRRLGVPDDAVPDAVQDALLVLHRWRHEFAPDAKPTTIAYGVLLHVASDHRRRLRRSSRLFAFFGDAMPETAATTASPFEELERAAAGRSLQRVLSALPEATREVFVLVELEALELREAATTLGLSESTCKSRLKTARRAFNEAAVRERARLQRGLR